MGVKGRFDPYGKHVDKYKNKQNWIPCCSWKPAQKAHPPCSAAQGWSEEGSSALSEAGEALHSAQNYQT